MGMPPLVVTNGVFDCIFDRMQLLRPSVVVQGGTGCQIGSRSRVRPFLAATHSGRFTLC